MSDLEKVRYATQVRKEIEAKFKQFDKDCNGVLDQVEIRDAIKTMNAELMSLDLSEDDITDMINQLDRDGDGQIRIDEFIALLVDV